MPGAPDSKPSPGTLSLPRNTANYQHSSSIDISPSPSCMAMSAGASGNKNISPRSSSHRPAEGESERRGSGHSAGTGGNFPSPRSRGERIARLGDTRADRMRGHMPRPPVTATTSLPPVLESTALINADLAPIPPRRRTWSMWNIAALWVGMSICITTYTLASSLIDQGMNWKQAVITIFLGNLIVLIPMTLNAHPGTAYGIPFPVLIRASFGTLGSNIPALMRAFVACGWFGIQTWIGGAAIHAMLSIIFGFDSAQKTALPIIGISAGEFLCFLGFWTLNILVIIRGMDSIKWLESFAAPSFQP